MTTSKSAGNVAKLRGIVHVTDPRFGAKGDWNGVTGTDDTVAIQAAIDSGASRVILPAPGQYYVNGAIITVNLSNFELVIEGGASLVKGNSGATLQVGSVAGTYTGVRITGRGRIRPTVVPHSVASAGILVGANGVTVDGLIIDIDIQDMGQYGISSGSTAATIRNFVIPDGVIVSVNPTGAWFGGGNVAQAFDFNLTTGGASNGRIGAARFTITDGAGSTDAFKWRNFSGVISGAFFEGGSVTVLTLTDATNFVLDGIKLAKTFNGGAGLAIGLTAGPGQITGVEAKTTTTTIPMLYLGASATLTDIEVDGFRTNGVIDAGANTTASGCTLRNITTKGGGIDFSTLTSFSDGVLDGCKTAGRIYVKGNDNVIRNFDVSMGGTATEGVHANGNDNRVLNGTVRDTTDRGVRLTGDRNLLDNLVADNCSTSARIVSGTSNVIGKITFLNSSAAPEDAGTTSVLPFKSLTGLTGSVTVAAPNNPTGRTTLRFSALGGATTITNITGAATGDQVTLVNEDAANTVTLDRTTAVLAGGANAVLGQYDTIRVIFNDSLWHEISRAANS